LFEGKIIIFSTVITPLNSTNISELVMVQLLSLYHVHYSIQKIVVIIGIVLVVMKTPKRGEKVYIRWGVSKNRYLHIISMMK
ncbi:hypothetical protein WBW39_21890, partial [Pectobacterium versatile]